MDGMDALFTVMPKQEQKIHKPFS